MTTGMILSVSGIGPARTSDAYHHLKGNLQDRLPEKRLVFVGNPFSGWPHPMKWAQQERDLDATSRLLNCWATLNEFVMKKVAPVLSDGGIVVTERFGLDALLYATALQERTDENEAAEKMHHGALVPMRIVQQGIKPPVYFIPSARPDIITTEWLASSTSLRDVEPEDMRRYIVHDDAMMKRYFDPKHGQNTPVWLDASLPTKDMCEVAILHIARMVGKQSAAA